MDADRLVEKAEGLTEEQRRLLAEALRRSPFLKPIPTPDEDPLLNSGDRKRDEMLEKWQQENSGRRLKKAWT